MGRHDFFLAACKMNENPLFQEVQLIIGVVQLVVSRTRCVGLFLHFFVFFWSQIWVCVVGRIPLFGCLIEIKRSNQSQKRACRHRCTRCTGCVSRWFWQEMRMPTGPEWNAGRPFSRVDESRSRRRRSEFSVHCGEFLNVVQVNVFF